MVYLIPQPQMYINLFLVDDEFDQVSQRSQLVFFVFLSPFFLSFSFFFFFFRSSLVIGRCSGSGVGVGSEIIKSLHLIVQKFWCFSKNLGLEHRRHFRLTRSASFSRGFASASWLQLVSPHPSQNSLCLALNADRKHFWHFFDVFVC